MAQTIEGYVGATEWTRPSSRPIHYRVFALIAAGYFFDVSNFIVARRAGAEHDPQPNFLTAGEVATVASAQTFGLFVGTVGQGEFTDRWGRKARSTSSTCCCSAWPRSWSAFTPNFTSGWRCCASSPGSASAPSSPCASPMRENTRRSASAGASWPASSSSAARWSGRCPPCSALFFLGSIGWRGIWVVYGVGALIVFILRFSLPKSPRWLATHGQGERALGLLEPHGPRAAAGGGG